MNIQGLILDWAGTAVDFGSQCPVAAFQQAFARHDVVLTAEPVHRFMGMRKRDHLRSILNVPEVARQWLEVRGTAPSDTDIEQLYIDTENLMVELAPGYAQPVPGLLEAVDEVRRRGLKIGSTTGYTARIMEPLSAAASTLGYTPEHWVAADQVKAGRPWPWMLFANLEKLAICPPSAVVKIGDTLIDLEEGRNAGTWNIAVINSSSVMGMSPAAWTETPDDEIERRSEEIRDRFRAAGAHYVIATLHELCGVLDTIEHRIGAGELPPPHRS